MGSSTPASPNRSHSSSMNSPEFEFWGLSDTNNPSTFPSTNLPSADELFSDGILLPLQTLNLSSPSTKSNPNSPHSLLDASNSFSNSPGPASKRWKNIFVKTGERERRKADQKSRLSVGNNMELNINIWPFSRSRSAGNASRARLATWRNVSSASAPCSRSNSRNAESSAQDGPIVEPNTASSMIKRWAQTGKLGPSVGIKVGRVGPVWQLRRNKQQQQQKQEQSRETGDQNDVNGNENGVEGQNVDVNTCIGNYRNKSSCSDNGGGGGNNGGLFSIKAIFSKKVY